MKDRTKMKPKCLTKLWGSTLLEWQLKAIRESGVTDIAVITGYHAQEIKKRFPGLKYFHNAEWETTNMVSTLFCASEWLESDDCLISYSDILYSNKAVRSLLIESADISLTYYTKFQMLWKERFENPLDDIETFKINRQGKLIEIGQKASSFSEIEGQYMGLLKFKPNGWNRICKETANGLPKPLAKMDMTGLLNYLIKQDVNIKGIPYDGLWLEVDSQEDLLLYESWNSVTYLQMLNEL